MDKTKLLLAAHKSGEGACLLFLFSAPLSIAVNNIALAATALAAAAFLAIKGVDCWRRLAPCGSQWTALAFTSLSILSVIFAEEPKQALYRLPSILLLIAAPLVFMPFVGSTLITRNWSNVLLLGIVLGLVVIIIKGPAANSIIPRYAPFMGLMNYAGALALLAPVIFGCLIASSFAGDHRHTLLFTVSFSGITLGALHSGTRIAWLSIVVTTFFLLFVNIRNLTWRLVAIMFVLTAAVMSFFFLNSFLSDRLASIDPFYHKKSQNTNIAPQDKASQQSTNSSSQIVSVAPSNVSSQSALSNRIRIALWKDAIKRLPDLPFFGFGPGGGYHYSENANNKPDGQKPLTGGHYHNTLLTIVIEMGIPGAVALLALFIPSLVLAAQNLRHPNPRFRQWAKILFALILAVFIHSMTDTLFQIKTTVQLFTFLLIMCWANLQKTEDTQIPLDNKSLS